MSQADPEEPGLTTPRIVELSQKHKTFARQKEVGFTELLMPL